MVSVRNLIHRLMLFKNRSNKINDTTISSDTFYDVVNFKRRPKHQTKKSDDDDDNWNEIKMGDLERIIQNIDIQIQKKKNSLA